MTAGDVGLLMGALGTLAGALAGAYAVWIRWGHLWRRGAVAILEGHIDRIHQELKLTKIHLAQKQEAIDELYEMNFECELNEMEVYGWIVRVTERTARESEKLRAKGIEPEPPLAPPARRPAVEKSKKHAAYLRRRAKHNSEMAAMVADRLTADAPEEGGEPKTY